MGSSNIGNTVSDILNDWRDRIRDPFIASFLFFFLVWNWKFFYALLGSGPQTDVRETIEYARSFVSRGWNSDEILASIWRTPYTKPLLSSLAYVFLYPLAKIGIVKWWTWINALIANVKHKAEGKDERIALKRLSNANDHFKTFVQSALKSMGGPHSFYEFVEWHHQAEIGSLIRLNGERVELIPKNTRIGHDGSKPIRFVIGHIPDQHLIVASNNAVIPLFEGMDPDLCPYHVVNDGELVPQRDIEAYKNKHRSATTFATLLKHEKSRTTVVLNLKAR